MPAVPHGRGFVENKWQLKGSETVASLHSLILGTATSRAYWTLALESKTDSRTGPDELPLVYHNIHWYIIPTNVCFTFGLLFTLRFEDHYQGSSRAHAGVRRKHSASSTHIRNLPYCTEGVRVPADRSRSVQRRVRGIRLLLSAASGTCHRRNATSLGLQEGQLPRLQRQSRDQTTFRIL